MKTLSHTLLIAASVLAIGAGLAYAQDEPASATDPLPEKLASPEIDPELQAPKVAARRIMPVQTLVADGDGLHLNGHRDHRQIEFWVDSGVSAREALLNLGYMSSDRILARESSIEVELNDLAIASLPIVEGKQPVRAQIKLPKSLIDPGVNRIELTATQEHVLGCGSHLRPELWTSLDPNSSYLMLDELREAQPLVLSALDEPGRWWPLAGRPVDVFTTSSSIDDTLLKVGNLVAQGYALRSQSPDLRFRHQIWETQPEAEDENARSALKAQEAPTQYGIDVLIGLRHELADTPADAIAKDVTGPTLAIVERDGSSPLLVISGLQQRDLMMASAAFANPAITWSSDSQSMPIKRVLSAEAPQSTTLISGQPYRFGSLDFDQSDSIDPVASIEFDLPADFYATDNRRAEVSLSYAYAPGIPTTATIEVVVNDDIANVVRLESSSGDIVTDRRLPIELARLRPGTNEIRFVPILEGDGLGECPDQVANRPRIEFFEDSTLTLPELVRVSHQPDLNLFRSSSLPYGAKGGADAELVVATNDPETVGAAWTLTGRLARSAGQPLVDLQTSLFRARSAGHTILLGAYDALPETVHQDRNIDPVLLQSVDLDIPLSSTFARNGSEPAVGDVHLASTLPIEAETTVLTRSEGVSDEALVPVDRSPDQANARRDAWRSQIAAEPDVWPEFLKDYDGLKRTLSDGFVDIAGFFRSTPLHAGQLAFRDQSFDAMIAAFESPEHDGRTTTVITARTPEELRNTVENLVRPAVWNELEGTAAAWNASGSTVSTAALVPKFRTSDIPETFHEKRLYYANVLAANPMHWVMIAGGAIAVISLFGWLAIRVRQH